MSTENQTDKKYYFECYVCGRSSGTAGTTLYKKILPDKKKVYVCQEHRDDKKALSYLCSSPRGEND